MQPLWSMIFWSKMTHHKTRFFIRFFRELEFPKVKICKRKSKSFHSHQFYFQNMLISKCIRHQIQSRLKKAIKTKNGDLTFPKFNSKENNLPGTIIVVQITIIVHIIPWFSSHWFSWFGFIQEFNWLLSKVYNFIIFLASSQGSSQPVFDVVFVIVFFDFLVDKHFLRTGQGLNPQPTPHDFPHDYKGWFVNKFRFVTVTNLCHWLCHCKSVTEVTIVTWFFLTLLSAEKETTKVNWALHILAEY